MCGIFAVAGRQPVAGILLEGLRRLEYRGYDSAGIATLNDNNIECIKVEGNVSTLSSALDSHSPFGNTGIAHTRWATHGAPTIANSHPHIAPGVAVVHNGIIENHAALRQQLQQDGCTIPLLAGPEIGVASTKAFTAQLMVLARIVLHAAAQRGMDKLKLRGLHDALACVPDLMQTALHNEPAVIEAAEAMSDATSAIFVGRGDLYPLACEGALKLKETSYIHAEGFAAGELKHGPIALIDQNMPVVALAGSSALLGKLASNIREISARGGRILAVGDRDALMSMSDVAERMLTIPTAPDFVLPIIAAVPMQLLSYHVACSRGLNVDRPRNLAKSVTVE